MEKEEEKKVVAPPLPPAEDTKKSHCSSGCCGHQDEDEDEVDDVIGADTDGKNRHIPIEECKIEEVDEDEDVEDFVEPVDIWAEIIDPVPNHHRLINKYSWDQNKKYVSIYVPYDNIGSMVEKEEAKIDTQFCIKSFRITVTEKSNPGAPKTLKNPSLCFGIHQKKCKIKVKKDMIVVKLKKSCSTEHWSDLSDYKKKKERKRRNKMQTMMKDSSTADMLREMYQNADDETRQKLKAAWYKGRDRREGRE